MAINRVVVVCAGNICRSPVASALLRRLLAARGRGDLEVTSAGLVAEPGDRPIEATVRMGLAIGVDVSTHRASRLDPGSLRPGDLVLVMEEEQRAEVLARSGLGLDAVRRLGGYAPGEGDIADPGGGDEACFERCGARIRECVEAVADSLAPGRG